MAEDSVERADAFVRTLDRKFQALLNQPNIGRARYELMQGLRSIPFSRYVIFYVVKVDGIEVVRVLHGARDLDIIFHQDDLTDAQNTNR